MATPPAAQGFKPSRLSKRMRAGKVAAMAGLLAALAGCLSAAPGDGREGSDLDVDKPWPQIPRTVEAVGNWVDVGIKLRHGDQLDVAVTFDRVVPYAGEPGFYIRTTYLEDATTGALYDGRGGEAVVLYDDGDTVTAGASAAGFGAAQTVDNPTGGFSTDDRIVGTSRSAVNITVDEAFWRERGAPPLAWAVLHLVAATSSVEPGAWEFSYTGSAIHGDVRSGLSPATLVGLEEFSSAASVQGVGSATVAASWTGGAQLVRPTLWAAALPSETNGWQDIEVTTPSGATSNIGQGRFFEAGVEAASGDWALDMPWALAERHLHQPVFMALPLA